MDISNIGGDHECNKKWDMFNDEGYHNMEYNTYFYFKLFKW
jgi:hypothetical protein